MEPPAAETSKVEPPAAETSKIEPPAAESSITDASGVWVVGGVSAGG